MLSVDLTIATGLRAESRVTATLSALPSPWQSFSTIEWRHLEHHGESVGEADLVVFHPHHGLIVFEIKAGAVKVQDGKWFYASGLARIFHVCSQRPAQRGIAARI